MLNVLLKVSLNWCGVTEQSLSILVDNCNEIETIAAKGCDIALLPTPTDTQPRGYKLFGCPLLSPPHKYNLAGNSDTIMGGHAYLKGELMQNLSMVSVWIKPAIQSNVNHLHMHHNIKIYTSV